MSQLGSNLEAKTLPKWSQVGSEIDQKMSQDVDQFFVGFWTALGTFFLQFDLEVGGPRGPKTIKNNRFFILFAISANLSTRGYMIDFWVNLAFNLRPKTLQNSTQEDSKIDQKGYSKHDASWLGIWSPLGTILGGFWCQVGGKLDPSWHQNLRKRGPKTMSKKTPKKC